MKEKVLKAIKSKLTFAVVLNLLIMSFCILVTSFSYANSRDFYNSILICQHHFYYSSELNDILTVIIGTIQYAVTDINVFVMAEIGFSFVAFTSITYVFADKFNFRKAFVFSMVINILFALNHYSTIDSSKTAALLLAGGFLLILNAIRNKRYNLPCWIGVTEILFGSFHNVVYFFVALGFGAAFFLGDMIAKKKFRLDFQKIFWYFRPFLLMFIFVTLLTLGLQQFSYSINYSSPESADYYRYTTLTNAIDPLPFPDYSEHIEEFAEVGIDNECEYELLKNGYYDDSKMLNLPSLQLVSDIQGCLGPGSPDRHIHDPGSLLRLNGNGRPEPGQAPVQTQFINDLKDLAKSANIHIVLVCHPRKEDTRQLLRKESIAGTADLTNLCDNLILMHRVGRDFEKKATEFFGAKTAQELMDYDIVLEVAKNRSLGVVDYVLGLYYEPETRRILNDPTENIVYGWDDQPASVELPGLTDDDDLPL